MGYGENSWLSTVIVAMMVLLALNINNWRRVMRNFPQDLVGIRRRSNAFDGHTSAETPSMILIIFLLCLCEGILMLTAADRAGFEISDSHVFGTTMMLSGVALVYYLFQLAACSIVGYAFSDKTGTAQWLRGFNASQTLLSFLLLIPAMVSLFYPDFTGVMLPVAICAYIVARMLFVCKGFRIFFNNFPSLLYFILYLCALEIVPLLITGAVVIALLSPV